MAHYTILGKDPYWMNFIGLMVLTLIEVVAVGFHLPDERIFIFSNYTLMILTVVAIPKFIMIPMISFFIPFCCVFLSVGWKTAN